ncbi:MFS transporter [Romboutsia sp.]|uniref:MFS transporter n=1 Tax=Romboutsia sp. TaxID=1965302 RepID=UPI003F314CD0
MLASMMAVQALTPYLYKDYFKAPELISLGGIVGIAASFIILPVLSPLVKKVGKKELSAGTMIITILPVITTTISFIAMVFVYNLSKTKLEEMTAKLELRRG